LLMGLGVVEPRWAVWRGASVGGGERKAWSSVVGWGGKKRWTLVWREDCAVASLTESLLRKAQRGHIKDEIGDGRGTGSESLLHLPGLAVWSSISQETEERTHTQQRHRRGGSGSAGAMGGRRAEKSKKHTFVLLRKKEGRRVQLGAVREKRTRLPPTMGPQKAPSDHRGSNRSKRHAAPGARQPPPKPTPPPEKKKPVAAGKKEESCGGGTPQGKRKPGTRGRGKGCVADGE